MISIQIVPIDKDTTFHKKREVGLCSADIEREIRFHIKQGNYPIKGDIIYIHKKGEIPKLFEVKERWLHHSGIFYHMQIL